MIRVQPVTLTEAEHALAATVSTEEFRAIYQAPQAVRERDRRIANRARAKVCAVEGSEGLALAYRNTHQDCMESKA